MTRCPECHWHARSSRPALTTRGQPSRPAQTRRSGQASTFSGGFLGEESWQSSGRGDRGGGTSHAQGLAITSRGHVKSGMLPNMDTGEVRAEGQSGSSDARMLTDEELVRLETHRAELVGMRKAVFESEERIILAVASLGLGTALTLRRDELLSLASWGRLALGLVWVGCLVSIAALVIATYFSIKAHDAEIEKDNEAINSRTLKSSTYFARVPSVAIVERANLAARVAFLCAMFLVAVFGGLRLRDTWGGDDHERERRDSSDRGSCTTFSAARTRREGDCAPSQPAQSSGARADTRSATRSAGVGAAPSSTDGSIR